MATMHIPGGKKYVKKYLKWNVKFCEGKGPKGEVKVRVEARRQERAELY